MGLGGSRRVAGLRDGLCRLGLACALGVGTAARGQGRAKPPPPAGWTEDDLLLFELRLGPVALSDSFPGFPAGSGCILPLGELCQELDLAIQVDPARGLAEGFLIEPSRRFKLDAKAGTVTVGGVTRTLDRTLLELRPDDIYMDTRLLSQCLPLDITVDKRTATVTIAPREKLPLQARWQREGQGALLRPDSGPMVYPAMADPYRLFEFPAVDTTLGAQATPSQSGTGKFSNQSTVMASGDLLFMSTSLYALAQDPGGVTDFHMNMGRRDPHAGLLGPLRASQFAFGEVLSPGLNLVLAPTSATGALVTNNPLQAGSTFDRHSFQGDLAPGWQVELYKNQGLVAFQASRADGRYAFLNIPLSFGLNEFRLVFYGPQGQRREETERLDVSQSQTPAGSFYYHLVSSEPSNALGQRTELNASYGLTPQLTAQFGAAKAKINQVIHDYTEAGIQGFWKPMSGSLTAGRDSVGGSIAELALRTGLGPFSLVGKRTELGSGFTSEVFQPQEGAIRDRTSLEASATLPDAVKPWFNLDFTGYRDRVLLGGHEDSYNYTLSTTLGGAYLSNQITRTVGRGLSSPLADTSTGEFLASKSLDAVMLRAQASYIGRSLDTLSLTGDLDHLEPYTLEAALSRSVPNRDTTLTLGATRTRGGCSLDASLAYSTQTGVTASLTFRMGLALEPREHHFFPKAQGTTDYGAVSVQSFLDTNGNGVKDPGEKGLPDLAFRVNGASHPHRTDASGVAFLDGLPQDVEANITVAPSSLDDPLMRPAVPGWRVTPREGHVVKLDVPIVMFGEITGTTYKLQGGAKTVLPGLRLELVDAGGKVVKNMRSAYDGFFDLANLTPGTYTLEVPETSARLLGTQPPPPRKVTLAPEGTVLDGVDVVVELPAGKTE